MQIRECREVHPGPQGDPRVGIFQGSANRSLRMWEYSTPVWSQTSTQATTLASCTRYALRRVYDMKLQAVRPHKRYYLEPQASPPVERVKVACLIEMWFAVVARHGVDIALPYVILYGCLTQHIQSDHVRDTFPSLHTDA
eukprot:6221861-Pyramimonas_sp.AAC.2